MLKTMIGKLTPKICVLKVFPDYATNVDYSSSTVFNYKKIKDVCDRNQQSEGSFKRHDC